MQKAITHSEKKASMELEQDFLNGDAKKPNFKLLFHSPRGNDNLDFPEAHFDKAKSLEFW